MEQNADITKPEPAVQAPEPDRETVAEIAVELLTNSDLTRALGGFKPDSRDREIALEFVNSYANLMREIASGDLEQSLNRNDFEIKDLVSHINLMMRKKDEYLFTTMVMNCVQHYRSLQRQILEEDKKNDND